MSNCTLRYLFDETNDNRTFNLYERHLLAGQHFPMHWHDYLELEIVVSGQLRHIYNNSSYLLKPGDAHLICYQDYHELTALTDVTLYCMHIRNDFLESELLNYVSHNSFHCRFDEREMDDIKQRLSTVTQELSSSLPLSELLIKHTIADMLICMIRKSQPSENLYMPLPIQQLTTYLNEHFAEDLTLEAIADKLSFSADYLGKLMKKQIGHTFNEYLNILRLKHACRLLRYTTLTVKEIAYESGYNSVEYFAYIFKKKLSATPAEYRRTVTATAAQAEMGYSRTDGCTDG